MPTTRQWATWFVGWLQSHGWLPRVEATYSRFGERGSIDVLAFHAATRTLLVVEIKTVIADAQGLALPSGDTQSAGEW